MVKPDYMKIAEGYIGTKEVPGAANSPVIQKWLARLKAWWTDDATPWCGVFVAECLNEAGILAPSAWYRAKSYLDYGAPSLTPLYGAIVVFSRTGGGHVGFVVGIDTRGRLMVLGGNQGDKVSIAPFDRARVEGFRIPPGVTLSRDTLPIYTASGEVSTNEA